MRLSAKGQPPLHQGVLRPEAGSRLGPGGPFSQGHPEGGQGAPRVAEAPRGTPQLPAQAEQGDRSHILRALEGVRPRRPGAGCRAGLLEGDLPAQRHDKAEGHLLMMPDATALATLIFAAMADIDSVMRCYQNERYWRLGAKTPSRARATAKTRIHPRAKVWNPRSYEGC